MRYWSFGLLALVASAGQACGDTWYVDDNALLDPVHGDCTNSYPLENGRGWSSAFDSLEEAVAAASGGDTILVANGVYSGSCTMNVVIDKSITIRATNPCQAVFDGGGTTRAIRVDPGNSVTIEGLRFVDCYKGFGGVSSGGAVYVNGSTVELIGCCFEDCGAHANGGAVYLLGAHGTFTDCHFERCDATNDGGAIAMDGGSLSITGGSFVSCSADRGGGVFAAGNTTAVTNVSLTGNEATFGGAMYLTGASNLVLQGTDLGTPDPGQNKATSDGGALYLNACDAELIACTIIGNEADGSGGGVYVGGDSTLIMRDSTADSNVAGAYGGAVCSFGSDLTVTGANGTSRIVNCVASGGGRGGAIACLSDGDGIRELIQVLDTIIADCRASLGGGAIYTNGPELVLDGGEFRGNRSTHGRGGAIRVAETAECSAIGVRFEGNLAERSDGGAIASTGANRLSLSSNEFEANHADEKGGAIYSKDSWNPVVMSGGSLFHNTSGSDGGAVRVEDEGAFTIDGVALEWNEASGVGGAVSAIQTELTISDTTVRDNTALGGLGGGVAVQFGSVALRHASVWRNTAEFGGGLATTDAAVLVEYSTLVDNDAISHGAGAFHTGTPELTPEYRRVGLIGNDALLAGGGVHTFVGARFEHCEFLYNSGGSRGGAIDTSSNASVELAVVNSVFVHNDAADQGGAIAVGHLGNAWVRNCSFALNRATDVAGSGGAIWMGTTDLASYNSVYWENADAAGDVFTSQIYAAGGGALDLAYSAFADYACPPFGVGVLCLDPVDPPFVNPMADDLRLRRYSLCIDAGDNNLSGHDALGVPLMVDFDNNPRFVDDTCIADTGNVHIDPTFSHLPVIDMGAFEVQSCICIADWNDDGIVNTVDFLAYLGDWNAGDPGADLNGDGTLNTVDFLAYLGYWAAGC